MTWNYRLVRRRWPEDYPDVKGSRAHPTVMYEVHEAYYDDQRRVWGMTAEPVDLSFESEEADEEPVDPQTQFARNLAMIAKDIAQAPILNYHEVPEPGAISPGDSQ